MPFWQSYAGLRRYWDTRGEAERALLREREFRLLRRPDDLASSAMSAPWNDGRPRRLEAMPSAPILPEIEELLRKPNPAVMATIRPDGSPHSVATWYEWLDGLILLNMAATRARGRPSQARPEGVADRPRR